MSLAVGFIGSGIMGRRMCRNLLAVDVPFTVFDVSDAAVIEGRTLIADTLAADS